LWAWSAGTALADPPLPLREMITDAFVETPHTVDPGHLQVELSLLDVTHDRETQTTSLWALPLLLKVGILRHAEAQLLVLPYGRVVTTDAPSQHGFGDLTVRLKTNLVGNDDGAFALALVAFAKLPTSQGRLGNDAYEGGVALPVAYDLTSSASGGTTTRVDFLDEGEGYQAEFSHATGAYYDIADWEGYTELVARWGLSPLVLALNLGVIYFVNADVQLDAELVLGLTAQADDLDTFFGVSWRF
jgi:hypothetical protein